jgi:signal transduction histidine kinase
MVNINEVKFKQIIMNLLSNAAKFSNPGEDVEISVFEESAVFCVSINDHGIGISASDQERIFDQFVQVDSSSTRLQPGTGLGLAITKSLIERMNGSIDVQSRPGMGSSFTVSFPQSPGTG